MLPYLSLVALLTTMSLNFGCASVEKSAETRKSARTVDTTKDVPRPKLRLVNMSERTVPDRMTDLATYKVMRRVSMYYKLDLLKDNALSPAMAEVMRIGDDAVRGCYLERLEQSPQLKGQVALSFVLSKSSGTMRRIARIGGSLTDKPLVACIGRELGRLPFNPPRPVRGKLLYSFGVDETVAQAP